MLYDAARKDIQTGDQIFWSGTDIIPKAIQWWTKSPINHVSTVVRINEYTDRVYVVEALGSGVEFRYLSKRVLEYKGRAWWTPLNLTDAQRTKIGAFCMHEVGKDVKYDLAGCLKHVIRFLPNSVKAYYCSELSYIALRNVAYLPYLDVTPHPAALFDMLPDDERHNTYPLEVAA